MSANLGRCLRIDKLYSRARDRAEMQRIVDEELNDEFEMPIVMREHDESETPLAMLMSVDESGQLPAIRAEARR